MSTPWTPGPWDYVPSNEHHGPYVSWYGDICDCYTMSNPNALSVLNGGDSRPVHFQGEQADANARLISAAPELYDALHALMEDPTFQVGVGGNPRVVDALLERARAALRKARGEADADHVLTLKGE